MQKQKKMRDFVGWATVTDCGYITWHDGNAVGVYANRAVAKAYVVESEGDRVVRVRITEAPRTRRR